MRRLRGLTGEKLCGVEEDGAFRGARVEEVRMRERLMRRVWTRRVDGVELGNYCAYELWSSEHNMMITRLMTVMSFHRALGRFYFNHQMQNFTIIPRVPHDTE